MHILRKGFAFFYFAVGSWHAGVSFKSDISKEEMPSVLS